MRGALIGLVLAVTSGGAACAQAISPMEMSVQSLTDRYSAHLNVINPYSEPKRFQIMAYQPDGSPADVWLSIQDFTLAAAGTRAVIMTAPFGDAAEKEIYLCAETSVETPTGGLRGQVCSRVLARRLR